MTEGTLATTRWVLGGRAGRLVALSELGSDSNFLGLDRARMVQFESDPNSAPLLSTSGQHERAATSFSYQTASVSALPRPSLEIRRRIPIASQLASMNEPP